MIKNTAAKYCIEFPKSRQVDSLQVRENEFYVFNLEQSLHESRFLEIAGSTLDSHDAIDSMPGHGKSLPAFERTQIKNGASVRERREKLRDALIVRGGVVSAVGFSIDDKLRGPGPEPGKFRCQIDGGWGPRWDQGWVLACHQRCYSEARPFSTAENDLEMTHP